MAMEADEGDMWAAVTTSPSVSPPPPSAATISTALSLNTRLHLLAASGGSPFHPGGGCYGSVAASPSSFSSDAASFPRLALLDAGPARRALEREMCLGHGAAVCPGALGAGAAAPVDRRKKRLIKNRESASRSRARKQTHVTQIESELLLLREENEQLRLKYDQGFSGGVGAGEEDPAEGALGALLILPDDRDRGSSFCHHHHHHYSHS